MDLSLAIAGFFAIPVAFYYYYKNVFSFWERRNVKGPKPYFFVGNMVQLYIDYKIRFKRRCIEEYGRVFGYFESTAPVLAVADPEVVRQICIKDFHVFPNHKGNNLFNEIQKNFIFALEDNHWRRVRALMSPTFTSNKMRRMMKLMDRCVDTDLIEVFDEHIEELREKQKNLPINLKETYSLYTMGAITTCCYALKLERTSSTKTLEGVATKNEFVAEALKLFNFSRVRLFIGVIVNERLLSLFKFSLFPTHKLEPLVKMVTSLIASRRKSEKNFDDYLQLLLDAKLEEKIEVGELDDKENHHAGLTNDSIQMDQKNLFNEVERSENATKTIKTGDSKILTDIEVLSNALTLMVVGLETTASLLTSCTYTLAFHKDIQEKLRQEIRKITKFDDENKPVLDYEALTSCQYLDAVLSETLRLIPPLSQTDRVANRDYLIEKYNLLLPKGTKVLLCLEELMLDEEYWKEPLRFNPDRFLPENKDKIVPGAYLPFGIGPRHCLGMRFSLTEAKLALAKVILNFEFDPAPGIVFPPENTPNLGLRKLANPIALVRRVQH